MSTMRTINRAVVANNWRLPQPKKVHSGAARWFDGSDAEGDAETYAEFAAVLAGTGCTDVQGQIWNSTSAAGYNSSIVGLNVESDGTELAGLKAELDLVGIKFQALFPVVKWGTGFPDHFTHETYLGADWCDPYSVEFQDWITALAAEVAALPEIDGVCMDFIRYPIDDGRNHEVPIRQIVEKIGSAVRTAGKEVSTVTPGWYHDTVGRAQYHQGNRAADWANAGLIDMQYCFDYGNYAGGTQGDPPDWPSFVEYQERFTDPTKCVCMAASYEVADDIAVPNTAFRPVVITTAADIFGAWSYYENDVLTDANASLLT